MRVVSRLPCCGNRMLCCGRRWSANERMLRSCTAIGEIYVQYFNRFSPIEGQGLWVGRASSSSSIKIVQAMLKLIQRHLSNEPGAYVSADAFFAETCFCAKHFIVVLWHLLHFSRSDPGLACREEVDGAGVDDSAAVFEQVFQMARTGMDGSRDASGCCISCNIRSFCNLLSIAGFHSPSESVEQHLVCTCR